VTERQPVNANNHFPHVTGMNVSLNYLKSETFSLQCAKYSPLSKSVSSENFKKS